MKNSVHRVSLTGMGILLIFLAKPAGAQPSCKPILLKPALIDTDGNGPTPATDGTITPLFCSNNTVMIANPWQDCDHSGNTLNTFDVTIDPKTNEILSISRNRIDQQENVVPTYDSSGNIQSFNMTVTKNSSIAHQGTATLIKGPGGGFTGIFFGPPINLELDFVFHLDSGGNPDYVSLPWGQMGALGVHNNPGCGPASDGSTPQIWIPLLKGSVDTDPTVPGVPPNVPLGLLAVSVPTISRGMAIALALLLLSSGSVILRSRGIGF